MDVAARKLINVLRNYAPSGEQSDWQRLYAILQANQSSDFGQAHGFAEIDSIVAFQSAVPIREYAEIEPWVERIRAGESGVLTSETVVAFERTSGSTGAAKWIPYTESLRREFAAALALWLEGLARNQPAILSGKAYWALSPRFRDPGAAEKFGLIESDGDYFPPDVGAALLKWLVFPPAVDEGDREDSFFERTLEALLAERDLSFISVWSPTFFLGLDDRLRKRGLAYTTWKDLWPKLAVVSCWADAGSARWVAAVRERSGVEVEPKGLLSTEGVISIPDGSMKVPALFRGGHFIEFQQAESGQVYCRGELIEGGVYAVILTTAGGLYRYRTGDQIQVVCIESDNTIRVRFVGREGVVCDLVGEKMDERFVADVLQRSGVSGFLVGDGEINRYTLCLPEAEMGRSAKVIARLRENPYFDQALDLGQLQPTAVRSLSVGWEMRYAETVSRLRGCRVGDVKLPVLWVGNLSEEVAACLI